MKVHFEKKTKLHFLGKNQSISEAAAFLRCLSKDGAARSGGFPSAEVWSGS